MKPYTLRRIISICLFSTLIVSFNAHAAEFRWIDQQLENQPIPIPFGGLTRAATNASFNHAPWNDDFPKAFLQLDDAHPDDYAWAEVGFSNPTANSVAINTFSEVSWTAPRAIFTSFGGGWWAHANAFFNGSFILDAGPDDAAVENVIVNVSLDGVFDQYSAQINGMALNAGDNFISLATDETHTISGYLYSYARGGLNSGGIETAAATMTIAVVPEAHLLGMVLLGIGAVSLAMARRRRAIA